MTVSRRPYDAMTNQAHSYEENQHMLNFQEKNQTILAQIYPCKSASNPHMQNLQNRIDTFDSRWRCDDTKILPSVERIAEAGMYYLGITKFLTN